MDKKSLGKRILQARKKRGFSQESVEQALELPQKALTRIESGERLVSTLELAQLAELFHMPIGDFLLEEESHQDDLVIALHRAAPGLEKNPNIQHEIDRCILICREKHLLENLLNIPVKQGAISYATGCPNNPIDAIKQGQQAAKTERRRLGLGSQPIENIADLLFLEGLWCMSLDLPHEMSGLFLQHPSIGRAIFININHVPSRQRFSYAHEYAHALFDADHKILISNNKNSNDLIEKRANAFAAAFLLPEEGIAEIMQSYNKGFPSRTNFAVFDVATEGVVDAEERKNAHKQRLTAQDIALIAHRFGASYQATVYRLHSLRYLSEKEREDLIDEEAQGKRYLRLLGFGDESEIKKVKTSLQPGIKAPFSRLIIEAYRQEKISRGRVIELSRLLDLPAEKMLEMADESDHNL